MEKCNNNFSKIRHVAAKWTFKMTIIKHTIVVNGGNGR